MYGLRTITGRSVAAALEQLFVDMGPLSSAVKCVQTDFDTKLIKGAARNLLRRREIRICAAPPKRQSQNGLVENHWATAVRMARAYLQEAGLPKYFWFWAIRTAFERMNMLPLEVGRDKQKQPILKSSFELFYQAKPDMRCLFPFGAVGFSRHSCNDVDKVTNLDAQARPGIALGRCDVSNALLFWSPKTSRFHVSADYKLDPGKHVRHLFPQLVHDGAFHFSLKSDDSHALPDHTIGDTVILRLLAPSPWMERPPVPVGLSLPFLSLALRTTTFSSGMTSACWPPRSHLPPLSTLPTMPLSMIAPLWLLMIPPRVTRFILSPHPGCSRVNGLPTPWLATDVSGLSN